MGLLPPRLTLALGVVVAAAQSLRAQCPDGTPPPCPGDRPPATSSIPLAVLYFDNASRDSADVPLAEGISEEVMNRLSGLPRLNVRSRYMVRRWQQRPPDDLAAAARTLQVRYLATGSVRRMGDSVRVTAELVSAETNAQVWSETFDRPVAGTLELVSDIAGDVAAAILGRLDRRERNSVAAPPTQNARAYEHFIRGNYLVGSRTAAGFRDGIQEYERALRLDPGFAAALARYALAQVLSLEWPGGPTDSTTVRRRAAVAAQRALRLGIRSSDAWLARGYAAWQSDPRRGRALEYVARAIALDSGNSEAWHQLGSMLRVLGDDSVAERAFQRALDLEPGRRVTQYEYALLELARGRLAHARELLDAAAQGEAPWSIKARRGSLLVLLGDTTGARDAIREIAGGDSTPPGGASRLVEVQLLARTGDTARARARLEERWLPLLRRGFAGAAGCGIATVALLAVGERALALRNLAAMPPGPYRAFELRLPGCAALRDEPEFRRLLAEIR